MKYDDVYNTYDARGDIHADTRFSVNSREEYFFGGGNNVSFSCVFFKNM